MFRGVGRLLKLLKKQNHKQVINLNELSQLHKMKGLLHLCFIAIFLVPVCEIRGLPHVWALGELQLRNLLTSTFLYAYLQ